MLMGVLSLQFVNRPNLIMKEYLEIDIRCKPEHNELLVAELDAVGYDSYMELETGLKAYIEKPQFDEEQLRQIQHQYRELIGFDFQVVEMEETNWNVEWEKNFEPIMVDDQIVVRASFHQIEKPYPYEIVIDPKMSFGTGHHATTYLVLKEQLTLDHSGKKVLDVGTGTGILAIMAELRGASHVDACDNNEWCIHNTEENKELNGSKKLRCGSARWRSWHIPARMIWCWPISTAMCCSMKFRTMCP